MPNHVGENEAGMFRPMERLHPCTICNLLDGDLSHEGPARQHNHERPRLSDGRHVSFGDALVPLPELPQPRSPCRARRAGFGHGHTPLRRSSTMPGLQQRPTAMCSCTGRQTQFQRLLSGTGRGAEMENGPAPSSQPSGDWSWAGPRLASRLAVSGASHLAPNQILLSHAQLCPYKASIACQPASLPHAMRRSPRRTYWSSSRGVPPPGPEGEASGNSWLTPLSHRWTPPRGLGGATRLQTRAVESVFQGFHIVVLLLTRLTTGSSAASWSASMTLSTMITWRLGPVTVANA